MIVEHSINAKANLLPFVCKENLCCIRTIQENIGTLIKFKITPEDYWNGDENEFNWLVAMLSSDYPGKEFLLMTAKQKQPGRIFDLAQKFWQHIEVMFDFYSEYKGYVILQPTDFMASIYPELVDKLFVYTSNVWSHRNQPACNQELFLVLNKEQFHKIPELIHNEIYRRTGFFA